MLMGWQRRGITISQHEFNLPQSHEVLCMLRRILAFTFTVIGNHWRAFNIVSFKGICLDSELEADRGRKVKKQEMS